MCDGGCDDSYYVIDTLRAKWRRKLANISSINIIKVMNLQKNIKLLFTPCDFYQKCPKVLALSKLPPSFLEMLIISNSAISFYVPFKF